MLDIMEVEKNIVKQILGNNLRGSNTFNLYEKERLPEVVQWQSYGKTKKKM